METIHSLVRSNVSFVVSVEIVDEKVDESDVSMWDLIDSFLDPGHPMTLSVPSYEWSAMRSLLHMDGWERRALGVREVQAVFRADDEQCFGDARSRDHLRWLLGYDVVVANELRRQLGGGYMMSRHNSNVGIVSLLGLFEGAGEEQGIWMQVQRNMIQRALHLDNEALKQYAAKEEKEAPETNHVDSNKNDSLHHAFDHWFWWILIRVLLYCLCAAITSIMVATTDAAFKALLRSATIPTPPQPWNQLPHSPLSALLSAVRTILGLDFIFYGWSEFGRMAAPSLFSVLPSYAIFCSCVLSFAAVSGCAVMLYMLLITDDSSLCMAFVLCLHWMVAFVHNLFLRSWASSRGVRLFCWHISCWALIHCTAHAACGWRWPILVTATVFQVAAMVTAMTLLEAPAWAAGRINERTPREGLLILRAQPVVGHPARVVVPQQQPQNQ